MRSSHGKFIEINSSLDLVLKACPAGAADFEGVENACAAYSNASSKNYSGLTMQLMFSILAFLFFLN